MFRTKLFLVFVFVLFTLANTMTSAQNLEQKLSIDEKNISLKEVLEIISAKCAVNFSYSEQSIDVGRKLSIRFYNKTLKYVLDKLLLESEIEYFFIENQIVLKPKKLKDIKPVVEKGKESQYTVSGYIKDFQSGEALIGAYIYSKSTGKGSVTNNYGYYSLTLPKGDYVLLYSYIGYQPAEITVVLNDDAGYSVELKPVKTDISEVIINSDSNIVMAENSGKFIRLRPKDLLYVPGVTGDFDIVRTLQNIPGVKNFGDGSSFFYVRGGNHDQNLILVDEAPIYNPSHLFGFFSAMTPDAINAAEVYKNDFPERFGGRLSSVIDVKIREGNLKRFAFSGSINPYTSFLTLEAPFKKDRSSFFISARTSNLLWINKVLTEDKIQQFGFYDINAKINLIANSNNRLFLSFFYGNDDFSRITRGTIYTNGINWNNMLGSFRWNHVFNSKLFSNTTFYYSRYQYFLFLSKEENNYWQSGITNMSIKSDFSWFINPENTFKTGFQVSYQTFNPGNVSIADKITQRYVPRVPEYNSLEYNIYIGNEQKVNKNFSIRYGFRVPLWQNIGPTTLYSYNAFYKAFDTLAIGKNKTYYTKLSFEPRLSILYKAGDNNVLQFSYARNTQFVQLISNSVAPFTSLDVWIPCGPNILPQKSDQFSVSNQHHFIKPSLLLVTDFFYKQLYHVVDYKDHANLLFNPYLEGELRFGEGRAYGFEIMIKRTKGNITGWLSYVFSRSIRRIKDVNQDKWYNAFNDSPHSINANFSYSNQKRWRMSVNWLYFTGVPVTTPVSFYYYNGFSVPVYGARNNQRLKDYHRLDVSIEFALNKPQRKFKHSILLTIYNVYSRKNPFSVNFNKIDHNGNYVVPANNDKGFELIPTMVSVSGVIPSISYKFKL